MSEKKKYKEVELARVVVDFKKLDKWRKSDSDDIPVCSFLSVYEACGLMPFIESYVKTNLNNQIVALDNIACNFATLQRLKSYIENIWQVYSLDIKEDNKVVWDTTKWPKGKKHYNKKMKAHIKASVMTDFANFCPGVDDELPVDTIVFRIYEEDNSIDEE